MPQATRCRACEVVATGGQRGYRLSQMTSATPALAKFTQHIWAIFSRPSSSMPSDRSPATIGATTSTVWREHCAEGLAQDAQAGLEIAADVVRASRWAPSRNCIVPAPSIARVTTGNAC